MGFFWRDLGVLDALAHVPECCLDSCSDNLILGHILRVCTAKQGVGLDFVRERGYGRCRWLKYPAQAKQ